MTLRQRRGRRAHLAGQAAENRIVQDYERRGFTVVHHRYRAASGEIDLIARNAAGVVFVEVKMGRTIAQAAERLLPAQMRRIAGAASEYLAGDPEGHLTPARFDVALVDGTGRFEILENAFDGG